MRVKVQCYVHKCLQGHGRGSREHFAAFFFRFFYPISACSAFNYNFFWSNILVSPRTLFIKHIKVNGNRKLI